jgi:formylglycine-generating enzyme required for sulfatase activity
MSDIFISYAREDLRRAKQLAEALEAQGWSVFWDRTIRPGKNWRKVIVTALREAGCVIVAWSHASIESDYVLEEAEVGRRRETLVPVFLEDVELPYGFGSIHAANLVDWDGSPNADMIRPLIAAVADIIGLPKPSPPAHPPQTDSRGRSPPMEAVAGLKPGTVFRDTLRDSSPGPEMVIVPPGKFRMGDIQGSGDADEQPVHLVRIPRPFAMGRYAVTFDEYDLFARAMGRTPPDDEGWGRSRRPVIYVSWEDAVAYTKWLSEQTGKRYRLPTEAEWEYAVRAGTETAYWWGDEVRKNRANCANCGSEWDNKQTAPVGSFAPNPWGLYDTVGNVWEWVQDCWHESYEGAPGDGSKVWEAEGGGDCTLRVIRGGSWFDVPWGVRSAFRDWDKPDNRHDKLGFRLAQDLD